MSIIETYFESTFFPSCWGNQSIKEANANEKAQVEKELVRDDDLDQAVSSIAIPVLLALGVILIPVGGHFIAAAALLGWLLVATGFLCWFAAAYVTNHIDALRQGLEHAPSETASNYWRTQQASAQEIA